LSVNVHLFFVAGIHLAANIPNFLILETFQDYDVPWREELTSGTAPRVKDGYYNVPTAPGWGIEVNEAAIAAHPEDPDAKLNMFSADWEHRMCR
jgi:galactonate dehydratase